jgi:hypothetical protein
MALAELEGPAGKRPASMLTPTRFVDFFANIDILWLKLRGLDTPDFVNPRVYHYLRFWHFACLDW